MRKRQSAPGCGNVAGEGDGPCASTASASPEDLDAGAGAREQSSPPPTKEPEFMDVANDTPVLWLGLLTADEVAQRKVSEVGFDLTFTGLPYVEKACTQVPRD